MKLLPLLAVLAAALPAGTSQKVVCYYNNWSRYGDSQFQVDKIDPSLCTHIVYSYFGFDDSGRIKSADEWNDFGDEWTEGGLNKFIKLRKINPSVRLMLAVGGWPHFVPNFQAIIRSPQKRTVFLNSVIDHLRQYKLDGLQIDCNYQGNWKGSLQDKLHLSELFKEIKPHLQTNNYNLSIVTSANFQVIDDAYDIPTLSKYLDFFDVASYDLHGFWDGKTGHVAPLYPTKTDIPHDKILNVEAVVNRYIDRGAPPDKLTVGLVGYGRTFTLVSPTNNGFNAPVKGPGKVEPLSYRVFCLQDKNGQWKKMRNEEQKVPYAVNGDQWVGYEDPQSLKEKVKFSKLKKLGGMTFNSLDMDDFNGICGSGKYPLLKAVKEEMSKK